MNNLSKDQDLAIIGKQIAASLPSLADLSEEQLKEVASWYLKRKLTDDMESLVKTSQIDLDLARLRFLDSFDSLYTKKAYLASLNRFQEFCFKKGLNYISMTPALADEWILSLRQENRSPASVRKDVAVISSFYTFLERQHDIKNIFRGTRVRPKNNPTPNKLKVPDELDFVTVVNNLPKELSVIVRLMGTLGLRAGAFEFLSLHGNVLTTVSKGKSVRRTISDEIILLFDSNNLPRKNPFSHWKPHRIENLLRYYTSKFFRLGMIKEVYSAHDFRHYFAVQEYSANRDIYRLSKLLNHVSIQTTQLYLRSLNLV